MKKAELSIQTIIIIVVALAFMLILSYALYQSYDGAVQDSSEMIDESMINEYREKQCEEGKLPDNFCSEFRNAGG
jgi:Tfp pilus assembly protein PilO